MKKLSAIVVLLLAVLVIQLPQLPWKMWARETAIRELAQKNIQADFTIEEMRAGRLVLSGIRIGGIETRFERFEMDFAARDLFDRKLVVKSAMLRSAEGVVKTENVTIDFSKPLAASAELHISRLPLGLVLKLLTGGQADATGMVSGTIRLALKEDGSIIVKNGNFSAGDDGKIMVSPGAIPGDNEQVTLVRTVLANFHYQDFSMAVEGGEHDKLSMLLQLRGNNPDAYNGREVKLNVRLTGDLINLFTQSVTTISNPEKLLEQGNDAKN